jgi:DNA repair protein RecN (Recombination protein N)
MLVQLHIENYALIDRVVVEFGPGLNVLTGETGAGKSMIVGALGLVLGQRAHTDIVPPDGSPTVIEALFDLSDAPQVPAALHALGLEPDDTSLLLKRVVTRSGSRCYINANLATVSMLQTVGQGLVDILGQHQHQTLLRREYQISLLDASGGLSDDVAALRQTYQRYQECAQELRHLQQEDQQRLQRLDLVRFQMEEIDKAQLHPEEEEQLAAERHRLQNAEQLYELSQAAYARLYRDDGSLLEQLAAALEHLGQLASLDPSQTALHDEAQESFYTLEEVVRRLRAYGEGIEFDPERLQVIEDRLADIARLKRKYGSSIAAILQHRDALAHELDTWTHREERLEHGTAELHRRRQSLKSLAVTLSDKRRQTAERLQQAVQQELCDLNMPKTVFRIVCTLRQHPQGDVMVGTEPVALTAEGIDEVEYLLAPNAGQPLKPLSRIASGGELSRVMLALKSVLARQDAIPTLILDEVDAGIGGQTAKIVGEKLRRMAHSRQIFCITHLPQIASHGDQHYRVEKLQEDDRTMTRVEPLSFGDRIEEIARMSGGKQITATTRKHAREMLTKRP